MSLCEFAYKDGRSAEGQRQQQQDRDDAFQSSKNEQGQGEAQHRSRSGSNLRFLMPQQRYDLECDQAKHNKQNKFVVAAKLAAVNNDARRGYVARFKFGNVCFHNRASLSLHSHLVGVLAGFRSILVTQRFVRRSRCWS